MTNDKTKRAMAKTKETEPRDGAATEPRLLRVEEVATRLALSKRAVWALIAAGRLPAMKVSARATRLDSRDVEAFVDDLRKKAIENARRPTPKLPYRSVPVSGIRIR